MIRFLQQDNKATKVVFAVIIGIVVISMVYYLVPGIMDAAGGGSDPNTYATVREPGVIGKIFGESVPVTQPEVARAVQQQTQGRQVPAFYMPYLESRAGQKLIQEALLKIEGDRRGLAVNDADLLSEMHEGQLGQTFFPGGNYIGDDAYMNLVQNQLQMTRGDFEESLKKEIEVRRLYALITGGVTVSDNEVRESYRVSGTKVKFDYAVISSADLSKTVNPTDSDLQAFFKQNQARYATAMPETRKIQYLSFGADQLPGGKPVISAAEIQSYYNAHLAQYKATEQVKTRHILIKSGTDAKSDADAKAKAEDILKQVKSGGNFAELAKQNSIDPGSKDQGGELPMMPTAGLDPAYGKAAMALNPGETSPVVKSQFGYHIIQTEAKETARTRTLAEVQSQIIPVLEQQKVGKVEQTFATTIANEAKASGLEKAAAAHGLHAITTDYLGRDGVIAGVSDGAAMLTQAFAATKGAAPAPVSTGDGYAVFQVLDIKAPHAPSFDEYKSHLLTDYRQQQVPQMLNAQLNKLSARAKELNDLHKAAAEMKIPVKSSDLVGKEGQVPDLGAMSGPGAVAFTLAKGAVSGPLNTGQSGIVLQVTDKQEPSTDDMAKNFNQTRNQMLNTKREEVFEVYLGTLQQKYEKAGAIRIRVQPKPAGPLGL